MTRLKSQTYFKVLFLLLKGKSSKNISIANIPILYKYLKQKKAGDCLDLIFVFSGVNITAETDFATFEAIISANTMPYAKRF
jgi:hypothetical protein